MGDKLTLEQHRAMVHKMRDDSYQMGRGWRDVVALASLGVEDELREMKNFGVGGLYGNACGLDGCKFIFMQDPSEFKGAATAEIVLGNDGGPVLYCFADDFKALVARMVSVADAQKKELAELYRKPRVCNIVREVGLCKTLNQLMKSALLNAISEPESKYGRRLRGTIGGIIIKIETELREFNHYNRLLREHFPPIQHA